MNICFDSGFTKTPNDIDISFRLMHFHRFILKIDLYIPIASDRLHTPVCFVICGCTDLKEIIIHSLIDIVISILK